MRIAADLRLVHAGGCVDGIRDLGSAEREEQEENRADELAADGHEVVAYAVGDSVREGNADVFGADIIALLGVGGFGEREGDELAVLGALRIDRLAN